MFDARTNRKFINLQNKFRYEKLSCTTQWIKRRSILLALYQRNPFLENDDNLYPGEYSMSQHNRNLPKKIKIFVMKVKFVFFQDGSERGQRWCEQLFVWIQNQMFLGKEDDVWFRCMTKSLLLLQMHLSKCPVMGWGPIHQTCHVQIVICLTLCSSSIQPYIKFKTLKSLSSTTHRMKRKRKVFIIGNTDWSMWYKYKYIITEQRRYEFMWKVFYLKYMLNIRLDKISPWSICWPRLDIPAYSTVGKCLKITLGVNRSHIGKIG